VLTTKDIKNKFLGLYKNEVFAEDGNLEIIGASFVLDEHTPFGKVSSQYAKDEHDWYMSQSLDVRDLRNTPKIWRDIASKDYKINSNYGYLVFSDENYNQYDEVLHALQMNPYTRQAIMKDGMYDFTCTSTVQYLFRDNKLNAIVTMRSSDFIFGMRYDSIWQKFIQEKLAKELGMDCGFIQWNAGSLHIYPRHFKLLEELNENR
jgi:thymidylate synthase